MFQILEQQNSLKDLTIVEFCLLDGSIIAGQCGEGSKLGCTVPHRHPRMMFWLVMWQIGDVVAYLEGASGRYIRMSVISVCQPFMPATCLRRHSSSHKNVDIPLRYRRRQTRGSCEFYQQILSDCSNLIPV